MNRIALLLGGVTVLLLVLWVPRAQAYPEYNETTCGTAMCHPGFLGGNGPLHLQHRTNFGVATCNLCHPSGGGTVPVRTYWSGPGGGYGCAGCHGQDYGEISPNSGLPKATAYGLRLKHVNAGITSCGTSNCHQPGALGHPNPFPTLYGEDVAPPYYNPTYSNLTNPCDSSQEDLPYDNDSVGLDNDGDGNADYPADSDCSEPPTPTPTSTPVPFNCGATPIPGCVAPGKAILLVNEKKAGKEKLKVALKKLQSTVAQSDFGDPVGGSTKYKVCVYDAADALVGEYELARAGAVCDGSPCWKAVSDKGFKYKDKGTAADGFLKMNLFGGASGKGKVLAIGKNSSSNMPTGVAAALLNQTSATVQVLTDEPSCFASGLSQVKKADGALFKAVGP